MKKIQQWICCALLVLLVSFLTSCQTQPKPLKPLAADDVIVAFGDSLTYGTGAKRTESYPHILMRLIGRTVINAGVPGEDTSQSLQRISEVLENYQPKLVILCIGGNDMLRRQPLDKTKNNLRRLIQAIQASGSQVLLIGVPTPTLSLRMPTFYQEVADELKVPVDMKLMSNLFRVQENKFDYIHFNDQGYQAMAQGIAALLHRLGALP